MKRPKGLSGKALGAYSLVGANVNYDINKNLRLNVGISNIFDKQIYRSAEGANTYNEPGAGLLCRCDGLVLMDYARRWRAYSGGGLMAAWFFGLPVRD